MRPIALPLAALALTAANAPQIVDAEADVPDADLSATSAEALDQATCRDRITHAREASGQPPLLQRQPASPDKPHGIYAVDRQQDGCSVMVMMGDRSDIRPLPAPVEGPVRIIPVEAGQ
jgi:hypothetical protein